MTEIQRPEKKLGFDPEKCNELFTELVQICQKYKPTVGEIIIAYGNLGYTLGASIGGFTDNGPGLEELQRLYYSEPNRIDVALMIQGLQTTLWYDSYEKNQVQQGKGDI